MLSDVLVVDVHETAGELPVVVDQPVTNPEDIHSTPRSATAWRLKVTILFRTCKHPRFARGQHAVLRDLPVNSTNTYIQTLPRPFEVT